AHFVGSLQGEFPLVLPRETNGFKQGGILKLTAGRAADADFGRGGDELREMGLDKMLFEFFACGKCLRLGIEDTVVFGLETHRIHPRLDRLGILHGLNARFKFVKWDVPQPLLVMPDQAALVLMVIWRAEPDAREAAPIHKREITL